MKLTPKILKAAITAAGYALETLLASGLARMGLWGTVRLTGWCQSFPPDGVVPEFS